MMNFFCKFYLNTELSLAEIEKIFSQYLNSYVEFGSIEFDDYIISCIKNKIRDGDDFTYWPYYIDLEPIDIDNFDDDESFIEQAKKIYHILKKEKIETVVACDFEDVFKEQI